MSLAVLLILTISAQAVPPREQPAADPCASTFKPDLVSCLKQQRDAAYAELELYLAEVRKFMSAPTTVPEEPSPLHYFDAGQKAWEAFVEADCQALYWSWGVGEREIQLLGCQARHAELRAHELWATYLATSTAELPEPLDPCKQ